MTVNDLTNYYERLARYRSYQCTTYVKLNKALKDLKYERKRAYLNPNYLFNDIKMGVLLLKRIHPIFDDEYADEAYTYMRERVKKQILRDMDDDKQNNDLLENIYWGLYVERYPNSDFKLTEADWLASINHAFEVLWNVVDAFTSIFYFDRIGQKDRCFESDPVFELTAEVYESMNLLRNLKIFEKNSSGGVKFST